MRAFSDVVLETMSWLLTIFHTTISPSAQRTKIVSPGLAGKLHPQSRSTLDVSHFPKGNCFLLAWVTLTTVPYDVRNCLNLLWHLGTVSPSQPLASNACIMNDYVKVCKFQVMTLFEMARRRSPGRAGSTQPLLGSFCSPSRLKGSVIVSKDFIEKESYG